jgi:hypothetical protein
MRHIPLAAMLTAASAYLIAFKLSFACSNILACSTAILALSQTKK